MQDFIVWIWNDFGGMVERRISATNPHVVIETLIRQAVHPSRIHHIEAV